MNVIQRLPGEQPLFPDLFATLPVQVSLFDDSAMPKVPRWEQREKHGCLQSRCICPDGSISDWEFQITGFFTEHGLEYGNVLMADHKTKIACLMDERGRVLIAGKWYTRRNWNH